jgi:hypothetical protein
MIFICLATIVTSEHAIQPPSFKFLACSHARSRPNLGPRFHPEDALAWDRGALCNDASTQ